MSLLLSFLLNKEEKCINVLWKLFEDVIFRTVFKVKTFSKTFKKFSFRGGQFVWISCFTKLYRSVDTETQIATFSYNYLPYLFLNSLFLTNWSMTYIQLCVMGWSISPKMPKPEALVSVNATLFGNDSQM